MDKTGVAEKRIGVLGRIKWARSLVSHLDELLSNVTTHHILKHMPSTIELSKRHKLAENMLKSFEADMVALWMNQHVWFTFYFMLLNIRDRSFYLFKVSDVDNCLLRNLLAVCPEQQKLKVNIHNTIPLLIREADLMMKMDLPIPMVALTLFAKRDHFSLVQDHLQVTKNYVRVNNSISLLSFSSSSTTFWRLWRTLNWRWDLCSYHIL